MGNLNPRAAVSDRPLIGISHRILRHLDDAIERSDSG